MQLGMVGAGRMGAGIVRRLLRRDHRCVVFDENHSAAVELAEDGADMAETIGHFLAKLTRPRTVWVMVPAGVTGAVLAQLAEQLDADDVVIDGGNSHFRDAAPRAAMFAAKGIHFLDVGTSGGVHGLDRGYCLMIGGAEPAVTRTSPIFRSLAPGVGAAPRTAGLHGWPAEVEYGYLHCGPSGAGHFVKMVHNGIEYGQMAALAEGLAILRAVRSDAVVQSVDAETAPRTNGADYSYDLDVAQITEVWRRGSVIDSWLLDLTAAVLRTDPELSSFSGQVSDSGEGRWTVQAAVDAGVPAYVLTAALYERFSSRGEGEFGDKALSAMRYAFGGHHEKAALR